MRNAGPKKNAEIALGLKKHVKDVGKLQKIIIKDCVDMKAVSIVLTNSAKPAN